MPEHRREVEEASVRRPDRAEEQPRDNDVERDRQPEWTGVLPGSDLLGDSRLQGRGNGPVRSALMQDMQQTHGNRAVQRFMQRSAARNATVTPDRQAGERPGMTPANGSEGKGLPVQLMPAGLAGMIAVQRDTPKGGTVTETPKAEDKDKDKPAGSAEGGGAAASSVWGKDSQKVTDTGKEQQTREYYVWHENADKAIKNLSDAADKAAKAAEAGAGKDKSQQGSGAPPAAPPQPAAPQPAAPAAPAPIGKDKIEELKTWIGKYEAYETWKLRKPKPDVADPGAAPTELTSAEYDKKKKLTVGTPPSPAYKIVHQYDVTLPGGKSYSFKDNPVKPSYKYLISETGVAKEGTEITKQAGIDDIFKDAGITDASMLKIMKKISAKEGGFEAVNTYDTGYVSIGFVQFTTGKKGDGTVRALLAEMKKSNASEFKSYFQDMGIDVDNKGVIVTDPATGNKLTGSAAVNAIIDDKRLTAVLYNAGLNSKAFKVAQVKQAKEQYWIADKSFTVKEGKTTISGTIGDVLKSEAGRTVLLDRAVQHGPNDAGTGAQKVFKDACRDVIKKHNVTTLDDLAKYEIEIIPKVKNRIDALNDNDLSQPAAAPPDKPAPAPGGAGAGSGAAPGAGSGAPPPTNPPPAQKMPVQPMRASAAPLPVQRDIDEELAAKSPGEDEEEPEDTEADLPVQTARAGTVAVQRDPPAGTVDSPPAKTAPVGGTQQPAPAPAPKDPKTDAPAAWTLMQAFTDDELKKQLGGMYKEATANNFFKDWVPYFGTPDRVTSYFGAIRKASVPGDVHMHNLAASRLEMVKARLGEANFPATTVALGLVRGRPKGVKNLLQHHLGLAIDFRTVTNPKLADRRLKTLIGLQTGDTKGHYMDLGDYGKRRDLIKKMGQASAAAREQAEKDELTKAKVTSVDDLSDEAKARIAAAAIDPKSTLGKEATDFYDKLKTEHERVAKASKDFRTNLPPAVQEYLNFRQQLRETEAKLKEVARDLKKVADSKKRLKKDAPAADVKKLADQETDLNTQNTDLTKKQADIKKSISDKEGDMATLFKDWIDKIDKEKDKLQKAAGSIDLSTLPSQADLEKQKALLVKQQKEAQQAKKQAEKDIAALQAKITKAQKTVDESGKQLETLNKELANLPADASKSKVTTLENKIAKLNKAREDNQKQVTTFNDQITAIKGVPQQPGQNAAQTKPTLEQTDKKLAEMDQKLKDIKARMDLLPKKEEFDRLEDLKLGLSGEHGLSKYDDPDKPRPQGKDFVFKGQSNVQDPSVIQLLEQGYMNPDEDYAAGEKQDTNKHGFNEAFFKTMAEFGFDLGGAWESPDAMHFELVEGLDLVTSAGAAATPAPTPQPAQTPAQKSVQRAAAGPGGGGDEQLGQRIQAKAGSGSNLDTGVQQHLESGLGADLSGVRVHTDSEADSMAKSVDAVAFTTGSDIFFREGAYNPQSSEGMKLLAHEATHTVQQSQGPVAGTPSKGGVSISDPSDAFEQAADRTAGNVVSNVQAQRTEETQQTQVQRHTDDEDESAVQRKAVQGAAHVVQRDTPDAGTAPAQTPAPAASPTPAAAPDAGTATPADAGTGTTDAEIDALDLEATAKAGATTLKKAHPDITFTSGRRDWSEQANAMAHNIVESKNRKWIEQTYAKSGARDKLQKWVDDNPKVEAEAEIATGLKDTLDAMSTKEQGYISKHPTGEAFDVQPQDKDAAKIKADMAGLSGATKFLDTEGGLTRWHVQFKRANPALDINDPHEQQADRVASRVVASVQRDAGGAGAPPMAPAHKTVATIDEFITFVEKVERTYGADPKAVASEIRQVWFSDPNWEVLLGSQGITTTTASGKRYVDIETEAPIADEYDMKDMDPTSAGGEKKISTPLGDVSISHVIAGIDAALSGAPAAYPKEFLADRGHDNSDSKLKYDTLMKASGKDPRDFATWAGDLGQAYGEYLAERWVKENTGASLAGFVTAKAPDDQLLGDIHGYIAKQVASEVPSVKGGTPGLGKVSDILRSLYMVSKKDVGADQSYMHYFEEASGKKAAELKPFILERSLAFARPWFAKKASDASGSTKVGKWWSGEGWTAAQILENYMKDFDKFHAQNESGAKDPDKIGAYVDKFFAMLGGTMP